MAKTDSSLNIEHIAKLSKLKLTEEEKKIFGPQLENVLNYFEKLQDVDTTDIEPTFHVVSGLSNRFQEQDLEADTLSQKDVLKNAKLTKNGCIGTDGAL